MDYLKIYNNLIQKAIITPSTEEYKEKHHIIPICMGGKDTKENIIPLSARQHYIAHRLLYKIYGNSKLAHAWFSMCRIGKGQSSRLVNSRTFSYAKNAHIKELKKNTLGELNHFFGKKHTEETKNKISKNLKGKKIWSDSGKKSWIEKVARLPSSEKQKNSARMVFLGMTVLQNKETLEIRRINVDELKKYDLNIWLNPRKITPEKKFKCPHCDIVTNKSNLKRWHLDKCKGKI